MLSVRDRKAVMKLQLEIQRYMLEIMKLDSEIAVLEKQISDWDKTGGTAKRLSQLQKRRNTLSNNIGVRSDKLRKYGVL
ncbi:MAG: hypothetical protein J6A59_13285 [Lachnospiraceae bacterium]|nr:hypothetical protein [Lachnospiraceae bacterium]